MKINFWRNGDGKFWHSFCKISTFNEEILVEITNFGRNKFAFGSFIGKRQNKIATFEENVKEK